MYFNTTSGVTTDEVLNTFVALWRWRSAGETYTRRKYIYIFVCASCWSVHLSVLTTVWKNSAPSGRIFI